MPRKHLEKPTQKQTVFQILKNADGEWVDGMTFLSLTKPITQYHTRIWELQKDGHNIEGRFIKNRNWKEYRLRTEPVQDQMFNITRKKKAPKITKPKFIYE